MTSGPTGSDPVPSDRGRDHRRHRRGQVDRARAFRRHGAATVSSDEIVHHLLRDRPRREAGARRAPGRRSSTTTGSPTASAFRVQDREALDFLEKLLHPLVSREYLAWREQLAKLPDPPRVCVTEVPLLYEVGGESASTRWSCHGAREAARGAARRAHGRPRVTAPAGPGEGGARRLHVREHGDAGGARRLGRGVMATLLATLSGGDPSEEARSAGVTSVTLPPGRLSAWFHAVPDPRSRRVLALAGVGAWVVEEEPTLPACALPARVRGHHPRPCEEPPARPGAPRRRRIRREPLRPERRVLGGSHRPDAAPPGHGEGDRAPHGRRPLRRRRPP